GKHEVLSELALVVARLFTRGGNRVGALLYDTDPSGPGSARAAAVRTVPPGTGRSQVLRIGAELARTAGGRPQPAAGRGRLLRGRRRGNGADGNGHSGNGHSGNRRPGTGQTGNGHSGNGHGGDRRGATTDLAAMLDAVAKLARRRALIVIISDFIG